MSKPWENDSCEAVQAYFTIYTVPVAAALWCGISPGEIEEHLRMAIEAGRAVFRHPYVRCLEPRCRAIHDAIEKGVLPCSRENGRVVEGYVAPERRHVSRQHLKEWIAKEFPSDKPAFLFDDIERKTHSAINAESFRVLQADRGALAVRLEKAKGEFRKLRQEKDELARINQSLQAITEKMGTPGERAETTYLNIIGALLDLVLGKSPGGQSYSTFTSQAAIISALLAHHEGKAGISARTLEEKFAAAKRCLAAS
jgi:hypothetical protein